MSEKKASRMIKLPLRFRDGLDTETALKGLPCDEEQPSSCGAGTRARRVRGHKKAGGSGGTIRERSRSPHESKIKVEIKDNVPEPLSFNPKRSPGAQPPLNVGNPPPGEIFSHFFDAGVLKFLCENTNKNAAAKQETEKTFSWTEIEPEELKKFIGMLLYMSILRFPKMSDFWRRETIFHVSFPATVMSKDRFLAILSHFHMSDPEKDVINERKKGTEGYDRLHWVRPLMEMICMRCKANYHPRQHLLVEDRMAKSKTRRSMKPYIKDKPTKWWLKFFALADTNGYTIDFQLYTGKSNLTSGNKLPFNAVAGLVKKDFLGSGYIICIDKLETSALLFQHLSREGFGACGEFKQEKVDVPTKQENALTTKPPQGSVQWVREGEFLWMDTRNVSLCSTVGNGDPAQHWLKEEEEEQEISIPSPTGEVESSDQTIGTSLVHRKTRTWPMTVFQHLFEIAVRNSFAIHKDRCDRMQQKQMVWQCFEEELAAHLLGVSVKNKPQKTPDDQHLPVPTSSGQPRAQRASLGRRRCKVCHRSTAWMCETCDVGLCLQPDRNCHWHYHQDDEI